MTPYRYLYASDFHGLARLAVDGVAGTSHLVEHLHATIARTAFPVGPPARERSRGISGMVYRSIRGINAAVGVSIDAIASPFVARQTKTGASGTREHWIAVLNGVLGDHLATSDNPLAIPMSFRLGGESLALERPALAERIEAPTGKLLIAVHGLCMNDLHWETAGENGERRPGVPARLSSALGYTPLYLHYNSGRRVSENGNDFATLLEALVETWPVPVESITILGHSMGGLVARSALDRGLRQGLRWPGSLERMVYLGTPHHGAPLERAGHRFESLLGMSPYSAPFKRLGGIRSAGIIDLRHGGLPVSSAGVEEFAIAATARTRAGGLTGGFLGDELVPLDSALGQHPDPAQALDIPEDRRRILTGAGHWALMHHPEVYRSLRRWLR
ncbi:MULTISPECIES: alpha/beta hydrolase [unclassified Wenzhouxiangella]|uniref:PGAP1-like alpha/beta domain-containing protein n=1 Tax=unclassified Wenzhouxiangella TaxID=2613841 RepID=UPI000E328C1A|nr:MULTISPECIES: alpha/beta hydrolase [unclassified Wenzhouxiangella]RFF28610.1 alpha/beta hydrolase [Wenzhouxiangella sp. 15181]RFP68033.1 alpha/beta hydrolase [Wenzhouxiangella sp. 15190]